MGKKQKEIWINKFGAIRRNRDDEFFKLTHKIEEILLPYSNRMSFKELYTVAHFAAVSAVGNLVRLRVNSKPIVTQKTRKMRKLLKQARNNEIA